MQIKFCARQHHCLTLNVMLLPGREGCSSPARPMLVKRIDPVDADGLGQLDRHISRHLFCSSGLWCGASSVDVRTRSFSLANIRDGHARSRDVASDHKSYLFQGRRPGRREEDTRAEGSSSAGPCAAPYCRLADALARTNRPRQSLLELHHHAGVHAISSHAI